MKPSEPRMSNGAQRRISGLKGQEIPTGPGVGEQPASGHEPEPPRAVGGESPASGDRGGVSPEIEVARKDRLRQPGPAIASDGYPRHNKRKHTRGRGHNPLSEVKLKAVIKTLAQRPRLSFPKIPLSFDTDLFFDVF